MAAYTIISTAFFCIYLDSSMTSKQVFKETYKTDGADAILCFWPSFAEYRKI